ncbi:probable 2-oxoglutarate-dependent dioxygenase ANS [Olea europaea var. sylvestris]|uniref:probable 2-oxoglutarate-dependent dioxygenase ANS n=1 Tax=Olea europaea var. sylvestris TaxID=158386 RepID=UPI000C1D16CD|nr:probable 2-oxoglutarate-dependent dioxygenase ANS [Olea europaea var. sylvestris]
MAGVELEIGKPVQELVENGIEFPNNYIWESPNFGTIDASVPLGDIPVIDISQLKYSDHQLRSALSSWGCFQAVNHGIENSFLEEVCEVAKQFFQLPMMEKEKYARQKGSFESIKGAIQCPQDELEVTNIDYPLRDLVQIYILIVIQVLQQDEREIIG